jgi:tripartite-type tricarboxylate transporter receptor subunit TctC
MVVLFSALCLSTGTVGAQEWPTRPVKLIVPYPAGGGVDVMARALAQRLQDKWQQPITIDTRPGANTLLGTEAVARATDNHTLLFTTDATFTINPHLYTRLPYDFERDFAPVSRMVSFSQLFVATAALPASTLPELIALARKQPGQLSYASYGAGSQPQLATEMLKQKAGVFIVHIPYRGIPQAVSAVVSGVAVHLAHVAAGQAAVDKDARQVLHRAEVGSDAQ